MTYKNKIIKKIKNYYIIFLKNIKGTRKTDPKEIYEGRYDGFNINYVGQ